MQLTYTAICVVVFSLKQMLVRSANKLKTFYVSVADVGFVMIVDPLGFLTFFFFDILCLILLKN